ncbi:MAG: GMC family oxidoreductase N-terminal domain-containing protein, partial [Anaerolineae bacterium]
MNNEIYDVIIIGTGAGGGTLAHELAPTGKKILLLERGGYLPREKENWQSRAVFVESRYKAHETWKDKQGKEFHPGIHYFVGGNTKVYGAALLRFREKDFQEIKHYDGISPAWPISYQDLAPYYLRAEKLYHVHGLRGSDPTEPPENAPYPYPAVKSEPRIEQLYHDFVKIGRHPFPLPLGLILNEADPTKSPCIKCNTCDGFPCLVDAKADAQVVCVDPALKHPNVTLKTHCFVEKLETSRSGREITAVHAQENGHPVTFRGHLIVLACGAINSAALLLRSSNEEHP